MMRFFQTLTSQRFAKPAAGFMALACYFAMALLAACTVLSILGRQTFVLHTNAGSYEHAIYAEEDHGSHPWGMTVHLGDDIHVWAGSGGRVDRTVQTGLSLIYAVTTVPMILAFWFLSRVFSNIHRGQIFTEQNACCLLWYGLLQLFTAVAVPFLKLLICWLTNLVSDGRMSISTGQAMFSTLVPGVAFLVAAYIIHYGVQLQDEVDHTL